MDNKIKELAHQANLLDDDGWNTTNLHISVDKFAELLINECINIMETHDIPQDSPLMHQIINDRYRTSTQYGNIIKEHFGIKLGFGGMKDKINESKKVCTNKADGHCPLHNLFCNYPDCER